MCVHNDSIDEEIWLRLKIHDPKTNANRTAKLHGTVSKIRGLLNWSGRLLDDAGFIPGWRATGKDCGTIDYIVLVGEAVERCWLDPYSEPDLDH
jgi:hypothetical protein